MFGISNLCTGHRVERLSIDEAVEEAIKAYHNKELLEVTEDIPRVSQYHQSAYS